MIKREADFQIIFNKYLRALREQGKPLCGNFELKQTTTDRIDYSEVKPHQVDGLLAAEKKGFVWKYSDEDSRQKPFDCSSNPPLVGWVVLKYPGVFYGITIKDFLEHKKSSKDKSITSGECDKIAQFTVYL